MAHGDTLAYLAMKLGGAELSSATLVEEYPSLQTLDLSGCRLKCTNLGPLAPLTTLLHLSLATRQRSVRQLSINTQLLHKTLLLGQLRHGRG